VEKIDDADKIVASNGQPADFEVRFTSRGGRTILINTLIPSRIYIEVNNRSDPPEPILNAVETVCGLKPLAESTRGPASTAFIAHAFNDLSQHLANELARFLSLLGIRCYSGRAFAPTRVSEKVNSRLVAHDLFFAIMTPDDDYTWLTQETSTAAANSKPVFILKQADAELTPGLLGDQEYIPFAPGEFAKTFIPILEGINATSGRHPELFPWQSSGELG
jgi:hypothetical protein